MFQIRPSQAVDLECQLPGFMCTFSSLYLPDIYDTLRKSYYKGANGFLIVYDVTDQKTFEKAQMLVKDLDMYEKSDCPKIVLGNKSDLVQKKTVGDNMVQEWADGWKVPAMDVSAKNGCNVDAAFFKLVCALKRHLAPWKKVYDFS